MHAARNAQSGFAILRWGGTLLAASSLLLTACGGPEEQEPASIGTSSSALNGGHQSASSGPQVLVPVQQVAADGTITVVWRPAVADDSSPDPIPAVPKPGVGPQPTLGSSGSNGSNGR